MTDTYAETVRPEELVGAVIQVEERSAGFVVALYINGSHECESNLYPSFEEAVEAAEGFVALAKSKPGCEEVKLQ